MGQNKQPIGLVTESQMVVSECEVTAILVLYGLPRYYDLLYSSHPWKGSCANKLNQIFWKHRLLTGYILAHEMMHAYLRLNGKAHPISIKDD